MLPRKIDHRMCHLFFVHSHATYHCALGVIRVNKLLGENCVFVTARDFVCPKIPEMASQKIATFRSAIGGMGSLMQVLRSRPVTQAADYEIQELARGELFHAYVPHSYYPPIQWALSHPLCNGYSYIEEGVTSYFSFEEFERAYPSRRPPRKAALAARLLYGSRLPSVYRFFQLDYRNVYGFTDVSFPSWDRKIVLGLNEITGPSRPKEKNVSPILVFDAMVESGMLKPEALEKGLIDFFKDLDRNGLKSIRYKYHPGQRESSKGAISRAIDKFSDAIEFENLPRETSLEDIFSSQECEVFVFNSASGIYASLVGTKVYSINSYVSRHDNSYKEQVALLPDSYSKIVMDPRMSYAFSRH